MEKNKLLVHKHLIIRAEAISPPMDEEFLRRWLEKFISEIGMKVMMGPYVKYSNMVGNRGITGAAIIETSHIVMHVWDEPNPALLQFDVYSCGEFNPEEICEKIKKDFSTIKMSTKVFKSNQRNLNEQKRSYTGSNRVKTSRSPKTSCCLYPSKTNWKSCFHSRPTSDGEW